jgi:prophage regulatory protein
MIVAIRAARQSWQTCHVVSATEVAEPIGRAIAAPRLEEKRRRKIRGPERWLVMTRDTDERLLRLRDVKQKSGLGTSTIYRRIADGTFPAPRSLGPNTVRWLQSEIDAWIKSLPSSRSGEPASASS